jgi:hypothetical protein
MRLRVLIPAAVLLLAHEARAQVEAPNGFTISGGFTVRDSRITVPLQRLGFALHLGGAKSLGERFAIRAEVGAHLFDADEWAETENTGGCVSGDLLCQDRTSREGLIVGAAQASLWFHPPIHDRLYLTTGGGLYALSRSSRDADQHSGVMAGAGWVLSDNEERTVNLEIRYMHFPSSAGSLRALIPIVVSVQF